MIILSSIFLYNDEIDKNGEVCYNRNMVKKMDLELLTCSFQIACIHIF